MPFGYGDTQHVNFPVGQDDDRVTSMQNRLGINVLEFVRRVDAAMTALNQTDPLIANLTYRTTELSRTSGPSDKKVWQRSAEYAAPRPQRGGPGGGWLLPIHYNGMGLGFTQRALETMRIEQFNQELTSTVQAVAVGRRADVLTRLFDDEEKPLDDDGTGATPGFAGSGVGTNAFTGRFPTGGVVPSNYTHYFQADDNGAAVDTAIKAMQSALENWHSGVFDILPSPDAFERIIANTADTTEFVSAGSDLIRRGQSQDVAMVDPNRYAGVYNGRIRVMWPDYQIAGNGFAMLRIFGPNNPNNALAWRYDPLYHQGQAYVDDRSLYPLSDAIILQVYGIGVWNRTAAALCSIGGTTGVYAPPAINR